MKVTLLTVGKTDVQWVREGLETYVSRISHYAPFALSEIPRLKNSASMSPAEVKKREASMILGAVKPADRVILLDERGREYRSVEFAATLGEWLSRGGGGDLVFVIGGAWGFAPEVYDRADGMMALSKMTYSHQMVRTIFAEQLYRAFTILKGEPYHNE